MDRSAFLKALATLKSTNYTTPKIDMSGWNGVDNFKYNTSPIDVTPFLTNAKDFTSTANPKAASSGFGGINLWDVLSGTLGQTSGAVTTGAYNEINDIKSLLFNSKDKTPTWEKLVNLVGDTTLVKPVAQGLINGGKEQWKDWTDGKGSWGDIPLVGFLHGMDKGWKRGSDILGDEFGVKNRWGKVGGGIAIDTALDPLTYLTFGLSAASKVGKAAELVKMTELAGNLGLDAKKFKNIGDFAKAAKESIQTGHADSIAKVANDTRQSYSHLPNLVDDMVKRNVANHQALLSRQLDSKLTDYSTQINAARNQAINAHINDWGLSMPFTNKFTKLGTYGEKSILHRSEATVPQDLVDNLIKKASGGDAKLQSSIENVVKARYGVDHTGQLSKTMFDDLHDKFLQPIIKASAKGGNPDVKVIQKMVEHVMPKEDFARLMNEFRKQNIKPDVVKNQLNDILLQTGHDPALRSSVGSHLASMVSDYWKTTTKGMRGISKADRAARAESMKWASEFLKGSDKYQTVEHTVQDIHPHGNPVDNMNRLERVVGKTTDKMAKTPYDQAGDFHTKIGHALRGKSPFNPRSLATGNKFVDSMAEHIADAHTQRVGETSQYSRAMGQVQNYIKGFEKGGGDSKQLMNHAIYILENHAPTSLGKDWLKNPPKEAVELAKRIKPILDKLGNDEKASGTLDKLRANYFPHVVNKDPQTIKAMSDFFKRHPELNNLKSTSKFNQERTSFQTLAQKDNYLAKIEKAIQHETDPNVIENLRAQQDRVAKMFDTNVVSALQRRIKEGVRAKVMKEMQTKLSKYDMMKTLSKGESAPEGMHELSPEEAKKLGLPAGKHAIHPEVLNGMKRVDDIFTSEGINKFVRHMTAFSDVWRPLVTYYKPSHYVNNVIGNVINNMAAGVKVSDYKVAAKLVDGYKAGKLTESQMKIINEAYKHNVISGGFLYDSRQTFQHTTPTKLDKIAHAIGENKGIKAVRHVLGEKADDISRLANYINGVNKYGSSAKAAQQVRTYLFNYSELTNADRTMRVAVPFWNWTKRNVPLQMKLLLDNPKFAMNNARIVQLFNQGENGAGWQKESGIHIPKSFTDKLGAKNEYYTQNSSPLMDLASVLNPSQELGSMNPAAKMMTELALNRQYFTGNPISYGSNTTQPQDIPSYLAKNFGIMGNLYQLLSGAKSVPESGVNLLHSVNKVNSKNPNGG